MFPILSIHTKMNLPKIKPVILYIAIVALATALIFSIGTCTNIKNKRISEKQLSEQTIDSIKNEYGQTILTQEAIVTNDKQAIKSLTDSLFNLKNSQDRKIKDAIAYYKGITKTIIKEVDVPYVDSIALNNFSDSLKQKCAEVISYYESNTITVPKVAEDSTANYQVKLTIKQDKVTINNLTIPDSQYIRFVTLKGGLLRKDASGKRHLFTKQSIQVQVLHTNPLVHVTGQNSAIYVAPKKPRLLLKGLILGAGFILGKNL